MPEQTKELSKEKDVKLTFSFPDVITVGHYETYNSARLKFIEGQDNPSNLRAQYEGARALIKAGVVHITSDDDVVGQEGKLPPLNFAERLMQLISAEDQSLTPANVLGLVGMTVAAQVEAEIGNPTLFGQSFKVSTTPLHTLRPKS